MKSKSLFLMFVIFPFLLVACSTSQQAFLDTSTESQTLELTDTITPEPTATFTPEPSPTSTLTPTLTPTITHTPTQAVISTANIDKLALINSLGNKKTFATFDSISLSLSGKLLAISGPIDNQVTSIIYETSDFSDVATFQNLGNLEFSSDESKIAGNNNGNIEIWDLFGDKAIFVFTGSNNSIKELAWSSETGEIAGVDTENRLFIWDSETGKEIFTEQLPEPSYYSDFVKLEYSPSGNFLSIVGFDSTLRIWDRETINTLTGHSDIITHSSWSPDGQFLATSSRSEANAYVWRMSNLNMVFNLANHRYWVSNISWSPNGERIATADAEGTIKLWNAFTGTLSHSFVYPTSPRYIAWSSDGSKIAGLYGMNSSIIKVYDINTKQEYVQPENIQAANSWFLWVDESIVLFNYDSRMQFWDVQSGNTKMIINPEFGRPTFSTQSPDGKTLAFVERGGNVLFVDIATSEILLNVNTGLREGIEDVAWSFDNKYFGVGSKWENRAIVLSAETGQIFSMLEDDSLDYYVRLAWAKRNNQLVTGTAGNGKISIWDIQTSQIIQLLEMFEAEVMDLEISYDGNRLAAIGRRGEIYVWNTEDWKREFILQGPNDDLMVADLSFSPNGNNIASAGYLLRDNSLQQTRYQIWDCNSQKLIKEWNHKGFTNNISFSPDGQFLASSTGQIWNLSSEELVLNEEYFGGNVLWTQDYKFVIFSGISVDFWGINP